MDSAGRIKAILAKSLDVAESRIVPGAFLEDLGADSLDKIELAMECEIEFGIDIEDQDAIKLTTVGDAIRMIDEYREKTKVKA